jgi:phosphinothricin acetyltransferase
MTILPPQIPTPGANTTIRAAGATDVAAITAIHNHLVRTSTAVWDETEVDQADRARWLADRQAAGFPVLIAADGNDAVLGYASYGVWRARSGYRHSVEHSVHVRDDQRGHGIGRALLVALIEHARAQQVHAMIGAIEAGNTASIALHQTCGFAVVGEFPQVGTKFGRWLDLTFMQLTLG